jgi:putative Mg2+ transporter-C (MgtC) family protein
MGEEQLVIVARLVASLFAGSLVGFERSFRGRPAGFRTHTLVCLASTVLMLVTVYERWWMQPGTEEMIRMDPTRMAQGIMTGIGFLGAGVIFKEGLTVRGLTTAASMWVTAAIGILIGIGFYFPAVITTILVVFVLSAFRWVESRMPTQSYARLDLKYPRDQVVDESSLRAQLKSLGFTVAQLSYRLTDSGAHFEYRMMLRTSAGAENFEKLAHSLRTDVPVVEFRISPTGD